jgi:2-polyprenyl-6-methoxyphenol hydroxylase-like FAD-dependent oxidoreductase
MAPPPEIAIIGAGPAGLTLASLLHKNNVPFKVYDARPPASPDLLSLPSGSLDLHEESGLLAVEACGLTPAFEALPGVCTEKMLVADQHGVLKYQDEGHGDTRPEVPRNALINLLLSSIPPSSIKWEHKLLACTPSTTSSPGNRWTLSFQDRDAATFDLVIGADGAWSRVRPAVAPDSHPRYSGIHCITLTIPHVSRRYHSLDRLVGTGSFWAAGANKTIMSHRGSLDSTCLYLMISSTSSTFLADRGLDAQDRRKLSEILLSDPDFFTDWGQELKELIRVACEDEHDTECPVSIKPLYMLQPGEWQWKQHGASGATLIGDAAHLMTPFAGEGVNMAMLDALKLAQGIITACQTDSSGINDAMRVYEEEMFVRAQEKMAETWQNLQVIFADDGAAGIVRMMESHDPPPES